MDETIPEPPPLHPDPEIAALLDFEPVVRRCKRHDGWTPDNQRLFILGLAETGNPDRAAQRLGRTASGAWKVRTSAGAEGFAAAWDKAVALHYRRNPGARIGRPPGGSVWSGTPPSPPPPAEPDDDVWALLHNSLLRKYLLKLKQERRARVSGRIVAADFYVRQLTWIEIALDCGGRTHELLLLLKRGGHDLMEIVATPLSVLFDDLRREYWDEQGGPERPPLAALGTVEGEGVDNMVALGRPSESSYFAARDGPLQHWHRNSAEREALAAAAQKAWEEKAKRDAEAWRARLEREDPRALLEPDFRVETDEGVGTETRR